MKGRVTRWKTRRRRNGASFDEVDSDTAKREKIPKQVSNRGSRKGTTQQRESVLEHGFMRPRVQHLMADASTTILKL